MNHRKNLFFGLVRKDKKKKAPYNVRGLIILGANGWKEPKFPYAFSDEIFE
jgi:hypothetical protein